PQSALCKTGSTTTGKPNVLTAAGIWGYWTSRRAAATERLASTRHRNSSWKLFFVPITRESRKKRGKWRAWAATDGSGRLRKNLLGKETGEGASAMQATVTPEQRQAARREIVRQVEQGTSAKVARVRSAVPMHRTTVYRLLKRVQSEGEQALTDGRHGHPVKLRGEVLT